IPSTIANKKLIWAFLIINAKEYLNKQIKNIYLSYLRSNWILSKINITQWKARPTFLSIQVS
ncbi:MAG: hypothetical protein RR697_03755, partial [Malacoplasma sp.]